jgi:hypothetical protein
MTLHEFREELEAYRRAADEEAQFLKDSHLALDRLFGLYKKFNAAERAMADQILAEWALSEDAALRFDAWSMINEFKIVTAIPALRLIASRLASSSEPGAPFELEKVARLLQDLIMASGAERKGG